MQKFDFTNEGFGALQAKLYQFDDETLEIEADFIRNDFDHWMKEHFCLNAEQVDYLIDIHPKAKTLIQSLTAFAIENRLPITLNKKSSGDDEQGKIIWPKNSLTATSGGSIGYTAGGTLEINIDYER